MKTLPSTTRDCQELPNRYTDLFPLTIHSEKKKKTRLVFKQTPASVSGYRTLFMNVFEFTDVFYRTSSRRAPVGKSTQDGEVAGRRYSTLLLLFTDREGQP